MAKLENRKKVTRIDLGDGDWAEIPEVISFGTAASFAENANDAAKVILSVVTAWSVTEDGTPVELNEANVRRLDIATVNVIIEAIGQKTSLPKVPRPE